MFKNVSIWVRDIAANEDGSALCRDAMACDGFRYYWTPATREMFRVMAHPMASTPALARMADGR